VRLIKTGPSVVELSTDISPSAEPSVFVAVDVPVRIEPPPKYLLRLTVACSLGWKDAVNRVLEGAKLVHQWLRFSIPRELCPDSGYVTLSADLDGTVLWQKCYRVIWKQSMPFLDELP
jgi:hypothetical protein